MTVQDELERDNAYETCITPEMHDNLTMFCKENDITLSVNSLEWMIIRVSKKISEKTTHSMTCIVDRLIGLFLSGSITWQDIDWADTRAYPPTMICDECGMFINKSKNVNKNKKHLPVICTSCATVHFRLHVALSLKFGKKIKGFTKKSLARSKGSLRRIIVKHPNIEGVAVKEGNIQKSIRYERGWKNGRNELTDTRMIIVPDGWVEMTEFFDEFEVVGIFDPMKQRFLSEEELTTLHTVKFGKDTLLR